MISKIISILGSNYYYNEEKSNDLIAHFEGETLDIIAVHGASNYEEAINAMYSAVGLDNETLTKICNKVNEVKNSGKETLFVGHSLGSYGLSECLRNSGLNYPAVLFAPYTLLVLA